jgi:hypothetical protein
MSDKPREPTLVACLEVQRRPIFWPHVRGLEDCVGSIQIDSPNEFAISPKVSENPRCLSARSCRDIGVTRDAHTFKDNARRPDRATSVLPSVDRLYHRRWCQLRVHVSIAVAKGPRGRRHSSPRPQGLPVSLPSPRGHRHRAATCTSAAPCRCDQKSHGFSPAPILLTKGG